MHWRAGVIMHQGRAGGGPRKGVLVRQRCAEEVCLRVSVRGGRHWVAIWSVPAKPFGRIDCLEIGQVELTDRSQRVSGSTVLKVVRQGLQPRGILCL